MSIAIIIPARLESTRLPEKLLLAETGLPLICHTVVAAAAIRDKAKGLFSELIVAADAQAIIDAVASFSLERKLQVKAVMTNPNHHSGSDRIAEAAVSLPPEVDAVLNLQGDEPELTPEPVLALAQAFLSADADIATLAFPIKDAGERANPNLVKVVLSQSKRALYFSRADIPYRRAESDPPPCSYGHVGIYLYKRASLERFVSLPPGILEQTEKLEQLRALENGMEILVETLPERLPKGIDALEDYQEFTKRFNASRRSDA